MNNKSEIRQWAKKVRNSLDIKKISEEIVSQIRETELYKHAKNVMIFYPLKNEINLLPLIEDDKNFFLPRVNGSELDICPYKKGDLLHASDLKIEEPITAPVSLAEIDLVFTPALAADNNKNRIGYGKGFYDRLISKKTKTVFIITIPDELVLESIPTDSFDKTCDGIITQKKSLF